MASWGAGSHFPFGFLVADAYSSHAILINSISLSAVFRPFSALKSALNSEKCQDAWKDETELC